MARRLTRPRLRARFLRWRWLRLKRRCRFHYLTILRTPGTPHRVAMGLAVGTVVGLLPIVPFQTITALVLCFLARGSFVASLPAIQITNPLTIPLFYYIFFKLGQVTSPYGHADTPPSLGDFTALAPQAVWAHFSDVFMAMMVGGLILGGLLAPAAYWLVRRHLLGLRTRAYNHIRGRLGLPPRRAPR